MGERVRRGPRRVLSLGEAEWGAGFDLALTAAGSAVDIVLLPLRRLYGEASPLNL